MLPSLWKYINTVEFNVEDWFQLPSKFSCSRILLTCWLLLCACMCMCVHIHTCLFLYTHTHKHTHTRFNCRLFPKEICKRIKSWLQVSQRLCNVVFVCFSKENRHFTWSNSLDCIFHGFMALSSRKCSRAELSSKT